MPWNPYAEIFGERSLYSCEFLLLAILLLPDTGEVMKVEGREYLCGTCIQPETWEPKDVKCEICEQKYYAIF